jgi:hypothetical protein
MIRIEIKLSQRPPPFAAVFYVSWTVALATLLVGCSNKEPPIGHGLPMTYGFTPAFEQRLRERFPVGSDEGRLIAELRSENFSLGDGKRGPPGNYRSSALYEASHGPFCKGEWQIYWTAAQGIIIEIGGLNREVCF